MRFSKIIHIRFVKIMIMRATNLVFATAGVLTSPSAALPGGWGSSHVGVGSNDIKQGAILHGRSAFSLISSTLGSSFKHLSARGDVSIRRDEASSSSGDGVTTNNSSQSLGNATGLYAISNIYIHQYPIIIEDINDTIASCINEDVNFDLSNIDNGSVNAATIARCELTYTASTAGSANSSIQQIKCLTRSPDNKGRINHSSSYNVTFRQQTVSPVSGFDLYVSSR